MKTQERVPNHLKKYIVEQNYEAYTPQDHAVWRYIMRQLKSFLSQHAHPLYVSGLAKTGISLDRIPQIIEMDKKLNEYGWGAVPVSGFIPPAAFMEFQSLSILPIASDMRSLEHILYTPAPDIVHEAAGHAPILIDPDYSKYLSKYADVASHAIITKEDMDQYEAIRQLSDIKENPASTKEDIKQAEEHLEKVNQSLKEVSEAGWLSRMNWWTAEYGLIGNLTNPKIFGAGLLSSIGESRQCLSEKVKKIPLTVDCIDYTYDITEPQPQLFVTPSFEHLEKVLDDLAAKMAFKIGGQKGLTRALKARTVNTVELSSGLQISGLLTETRENAETSEPAFIKFTGPAQLSLNKMEIPGHGVKYHSEGYSTPIGPIEGFSSCLSTLPLSEVQGKGFEIGKALSLKYKSGIVVEGKITNLLFSNGHLSLITFDNCTVHWGEEILFQPEWGSFDLAVGLSVASVFGGPADREKYGMTDDFVASRVPKITYSAFEKKQHDIFNELAQLRKRTKVDINKFKQLYSEYINDNRLTWLVGVELLEIAHSDPDLDEMKNTLISKLSDLAKPDTEKGQCILDGLKLAKTAL